MPIIQLYKVKKVKSTKSKSAAKKAKAPTAAKKVKGKSSNTKAKPAKSSKPLKKAASKAISKPVKKSSTIKKIAKPTKPAKSLASAKKKAVKPEPKKAAKKVTKPVKQAKITKPVKPAKPVKSNKPEKPVKQAKVTVLPAKAAKKEEKAEKVKPVKEKELSKKAEKTKPDTFTEKPVKVKKGKGGRKPKSKDDDDEPEIIHDELIEQIIQTTKKQSKAPKKPRIIQTFVNPINSLTVAVPENAKKAALKKEPKGKFELEYVVRTSAGILYELLTTPSGLSEWFADDVNIRDGIFTFFWDGSEQKAKLIGFKEEKYVRLQWLDKPEGTYFEFRIERDELTGDISLMIVDFADEGSDQQTSKLLWDSQVNKLLNVLGSN